MYHKSPDNNKKKIKRIKYCIIAAFVVITAKLFYLQVNLTDYFTNRSQQNFLRTESIRSPRGNITDRNGKLLATNRPVLNVYWRGTGNFVLNDEQYKILAHLEKILNVPIIDNNSLQTRIMYTERQFKEVRIASDINIEQLSKIEELLPHHPNITIKTDFKRHYPFTSCASHLVGYLGNSIDVGTHGKMGLEKTFEHILKGKDGTIIKTINSVGRKLAEKEINTSLAGDTIKTTIDIELQQLCERVFPEKLTGTFIIMDPHKGDILSLISRPNFDPSIFLQSIPLKYWQSLQEKKPFLNRALNACYPPGSIFKLVTISAALEHNLISPESLWHCDGFVYFGKRKYWCHKRQGHGELTTTQAVAQSCNILCFEIGKQIDVDLLAEYAHKFGLGQKTNSIFHEKSGLIPTRKWKQEVKNEPWWPGETLSVSIGQSFVLTTPIQIASMIASIFTGTIPTPRFLTVERPQYRPLDIKPETLEFLKKSMKLVVTYGTGKRVNTIKDFEIYAKTSTAQTSAFSKRNLGTEYLEHGWFVAYIKYKDTQPLIIVLLVENAGTSRVPTVIAKNFLIKYKYLIDRKLLV